MIPKLNSEKVTPEPYYKIRFSVGNRRFYEVKSDLYNLADSIGIEINDGYITEECDYEGDLNRIIIYNGEREKKLVDAVLKFYDISEDIGDMNVVLSM
jgi:hypothetical protein